MCPLQYTKPITGETGKYLIGNANEAVYGHLFGTSNYRKFVP